MLRRSILVAAAAALIATGVAGSAPGSLDPTFSGNGWLLSRDFPGPPESYEARGVTDIALQPDGKIVATGELLDISPGIDWLFGAFRYTPDGDLDRSFGQGGFVATDVGTFSEAGSVAIQPDGKIVLAGTEGDSWPPPVVLVRYLLDGSLDRTFGSGGVVRTTRRWLTAGDVEVAVQPGGKIVTLTTLYGYPNGIHFSLFAVLRHLPNGRLDRSFGRNGMTFVGRRHRAWSARALAFQRDGKIIVIGSGKADEGAADFAVARLLRNGRPDRTFSGDGLQRIGLYGRQDFPSAVAVDRRGRIVIAGGSTRGRNPSEEDRAYRIAVTRLLANGRLDRRFGFRITRACRFACGALAVAVQPDGRIVGYDAEDLFVRGTSWLAARYLPNGRLDRAFGRGGVVVADLGNGRDTAQAIALQPDGKIVVGGDVDNSQGVARLLAR